MVIWDKEINNRGKKWKDRRFFIKDVTLCSIFCVCKPKSQGDGVIHVKQRATCLCGACGRLNYYTQLILSHLCFNIWWRAFSRWIPKGEKTEMWLECRIYGILVMHRCKHRLVYALVILKCLLAVTCPWYWEHVALQKTHCTVKRHQAQAVTQ